jgi:chromosomal replication initiator protein
MTSVDNDNDLWMTALGEIETKVPKPIFETWLKFPKTRGKFFSETVFIIETQDAFISEYLETRMYAVISETLQKLIKKEVEIKFNVFGVAFTLDENSNVKVIKKIENLGIQINDQYTFDNFVLGPSNELAHAASLSVAENPGKSFNPLVIYSEVGLGKTHLLHAIANKLNEQNFNFHYLTCEDFTNEYIRSIRTNSTEKFRNKYRSIDALLLDDIQFLMGKEQTQEGFFHTFNALHLSKKQIVITSDRPISGLKLLEDRITSRLSGGLVVDIQFPDLETRLDILKKKALIKNVIVDDEIISFIASRVYHNIREMEGALNKILAITELTGINPDIQAAEELLGAPDELEVFSDPDEIISQVSKYFQVDIEDLRGKSREQKYTIPRQIAMFILREDSKINLNSIGKLFGGRDHSTVLHAIRRVQTDASTNPNLRRDLLSLRSSIINRG